MACNLVYAHLVSGLDGKQREKFDDELHHDPGADRAFHRALAQADDGDGGGVG